MNIFLQPPPYVPQAAPAPSQYPTETNNWNANPHLIATYAFLSKDEAASFASQPQRYLTSQVHETTFNDVVGTKKLRLFSLGVVKDYMWFFQRDDVKERNQWANYSNWAFQGSNPAVLRPFTIKRAAKEPEYQKARRLYRCMDISAHNTAEIMTTWAFEVGGKYRENSLDAGCLAVRRAVRAVGRIREGRFILV